MFNHDPQASGPQYLEDLATGYWFSEVLFTAVEMEIFTFLDPAGKSLDEITKELNCDCKAMERYLHALCALGLLTCYDNFFYNTKISSEYLVKGKEDYQGDSILWRKYLASYWGDLRACLEAGGRVKFAPPGEDSESLVARIRRYISAMDRVARTKVKEITPIFAGLALEGNILDVGAGSGAFAAGFLEIFPEMRATLMDIPEVLDYSRELMRERGLANRISFCQANILEPWPAGKGQFDLILLSNIVHAYSEREVPHILKSAAECLKPEGFLLVHDFFLEHFPQKAALFDLNMFINTYNGKVFAGKWIREQIKNYNLYATELIPLETDTAVIIAAKNEKSLESLSVDLTSRLVARIKALGFHKVCPISVENIQVSDWTDVRCRFGCEYYEKPHCPPNSPSPEKTKNMLKDYTRALLLEGEPPTRNFQKIVLQAEKEAFKAGFYKAFAYWAGPCSLCDNCATDGICKRPGDTRPSMEGAGIDVFETVRRSGINLRTLNCKDDFVKYFGLVLLE